jgi:phosphatidylinositol kinase/protein kinase (PI-3  family)
MYSSVVLHTFTLLYNSSRTFLPYKTETLCPLNSSSPFLSIQPLASTVSLFVSMNLTNSDISYKYNHTACHFLKPASFHLALCPQGWAMHHVSEFPPFFKTEQYFMVCIYHILLFYSSIKGYVGCFYLLAIVKSAGRHTDLWMPLQDLVFSSFGDIVRSILHILRLLDHVAILVFKFFEESPYCFPFPLIIHKGSNFSTCFPILTFFLFLIVAS